LVFSEVGGSSLFRRYKDNPILTAAGWPYPVHSVFNPGAAFIDGETLLLVRAEDYRGFSHLTLARSKDGITDWNIDEAPTMEYFEAHPEERWGLEEIRHCLCFLFFGWAKGFSCLNKRFRNN